VVGVAGSEDHGAVGELGIKLGEGECEHAAHAGTGDSVEFFDPQMRKERALGADHVVDGDHGEGHGVKLAGGGINGAGTGRALAAAEDVGADDEKAVGVEGESRAHHEIPPAGAAVFVRAGDVRIAAERVEDENGVGAIGVELTPSLVGDHVRGQNLAAVEGEGRIDGERVGSLEGQSGVRIQRSLP
jgi:hypothetical protein